MVTLATVFSSVLFRGFTAIISGAIRRAGGSYALSFARSGRYIAGADTLVLRYRLSMRRVLNGSRS